MSKFRDFIRESNRIEGIVREPTDEEVEAHRVFLLYRSLTVGGVCSFVRSVAGAELREEAGMDVRVGMHVPPRGGAGIRAELTGLLDAISTKMIGPYAAHVRYEKLHPFMDGNGRSGRIIWGWQMQRDGLDPFALPFLHRFYYQALDAFREPVEPVESHAT